MNGANMDDLVMWLRAQVDEDQRVAEAATPGRWQAGGTYGDWASVLPRDHVLAPDYRPPGFSQGQHVADARVADGGMTAWAADLCGSGFPEGNARHIANWDPARALREVEAKRALLDEYETAMEQSRRHPKDLATSGWLLATIRVAKRLAMAYADRPGYREEWRP